MTTPTERIPSPAPASPEQAAIRPSARRVATVAICAALLGTLGSAGCQEQVGVDPACLESVPALEIGTGAWTFEPLEPDNELLFYRGPQGGYHVFLSVRPSALVPEAGMMVAIDDILTGEALASSERTIRLDVEPADCTLEAVGELVVLSIDTSEAVAGHDAFVSVTVVDDEGRRAESNIVVRLELAR